MWKSGRSGLSKYENGRLIKRQIRCSLGDDNGSSCRFLIVSSYSLSVNNWFESGNLTVPKSNSLRVVMSNQVELEVEQDSF